MVQATISEQATVSALQAMAANPDYADGMHTMEQYWPGLRTISFKRITIPKVTTSTQQSRYGASERSRSPSNASTTSHRVSGETSGILETQRLFPLSNYY